MISHFEREKFANGSTNHRLLYLPISVPLVTDSVLVHTITQACLQPDASSETEGLLILEALLE